MRVLDADVGAGETRVTWDGRTDTGAEAPSGVYLYEVRTGDERVGGKMMLLK